MPTLSFVLYALQDLPRLAPEFCEAVLEQWIAQPANAWSSLAYCGVGGWLWLKRQRQDPRMLQFMGPIAIAIGVSSFAYHALYIAIAHFFDLLSMFFFSTLILVFNLVRAKLVSRRLQLPFWSGVLLLSTFALGFSLDVGRALFGLGVALALGFELLLFVRRDPIRYRDFAIGLGLFLVAFVIWNLDLHQIICDPNNHFLQGHAIWHILTALSLVFITQFYRQFTVLK
ncbi:ceramidase domain-containing protein [filamentous cyanobacterium LEGE 11480]|uniref:Ceramidase domain-containing protein n=1 Tax=Romeriopsis navalis LEGE 11480 TaxID=2777977 RepID=A0A928VNV9_9CYAN|nr:ceramidase [Romeriopsis navalis]MBE9030161.1 ceramidase domain-containing protein [Romeriopsis navalis LEGE 11480]